MLRKKHLILILIVISVTAIGADSIQKRQNTSQVQSATATAPVSPQVTTVATVPSVVQATTQRETTSAAPATSAAPTTSAAQPTPVAPTSISSAAQTTTQISNAAPTTTTTSQESSSGVTTDTNTSRGTSTGTTGGESKSSKTEEYSTSMYTPPMQTTSTVSVCSNNDCQVDTTINTSVRGNITTITAPPDTDTTPVTTITQPNSNSNVKSTIFVTTTFLTTITEVYPGYTTTLRSTGTDGIVSTYSTYVPPSTVVVVRTMTAAVQENLVASGDLGLEALNGIAISLCVIGITFVYMILA